MGLNLSYKKNISDIWVVIDYNPPINHNPPISYHKFYTVFKDVLTDSEFRVVQRLKMGEGVKFNKMTTIKRVPPPQKETEVDEGTGTGGGGSVGAFEGPFMNPIRRKINEGLNLTKKTPRINIHNADDGGFVISVTQEGLNKLVDNEWVFNDGIKWVTHYDADLLAERSEEFDDEPLREGLNLAKKKSWRDIKPDNDGTIKIPTPELALSALKDGVELMVLGYGEGDDKDMYTGIYYDDYQGWSDDEILGVIKDYGDYQIWGTQKEKELTCPECGSSDIDSWFNTDQPVNNQAATCRDCEYVGPEEEFRKPINEGLNLVKKKPVYYIRLIGYDTYKGFTKVKSVEEAVKAIESYRDTNNLASSQFSGGEIFDNNKNFVARVSYNGKIWAEREYKMGGPNVELDYNLQPITNELNEQKLNMGTLKLMEILTSADIQQIKSIAAGEAKNEANKVKTDLSKDITDVKKKQTDVGKTVDKHIQDKNQHTTEKQLTDAIKTEVDKLKQDTDTKIDDKVDKALDGKDLEKRMRELVADTMVKYHQTLWVKRGFWTNGLTK